MKKIRISLISIAVSAAFASNAFAADNLTEVFTQGTLTTGLTSYGFARTFSDESKKQDASIWVNGVRATFITDTFNNFQFGTTLQLTDVTSIDDDEHTYEGSMDSEGAVLSEAYLGYKISDYSFKLGRQYLKMPLIGGSSVQGVAESYQAYLVTNTSLPDTVIVAGKVNKFQSRTDSKSMKPFTKADDADGNGMGEFESIGDDGMYSLHVKNSSIENLVIQMHLVDTPDIAFMGYTDAKYHFSGAFNPYVAVQYFKTNYHDGGLGDNSNMIGLKSGLTLTDSIQLFAGLNKTSDDGKVLHGLGNNAYSQYTTTVKTSGDPGFEAGAESYQLGGVYETGGLWLKYRFSNFSPKKENRGLTEHSLQFRYNFSSIKNLQVRADYSIMDYENETRSMTDFRSRIIYRF